jgi:hypothetical protein
MTMYGPRPPTQLPPQDTKQLLLQTERWSRAQQAHNKWAEGAKVAVDFFEGRQWTEQALREMRLLKRPALTFNMIKPLVLLIHGYQSANRNEIIYRPGSDSLSRENVAEVLTQLEKSAAAQNGMADVDTEVQLDGLICGRGYYRDLLSFKGNDLGELKSRAKDPFTVYLDPDGDSYDLNETSSFLINSHYVSLDHISECYGEQAKELLRPYTMGNTPTQPITSANVSEEVGPQRFFGAREAGSSEFWDTFYSNMGEFVDTYRKTIRLLEIEHKVRELRDIVIDQETGDYRVLPLNWDPARIGKLVEYSIYKNNPLRAEKRLVERYQWTVICGDVVLYDAPSLYRSFSITPYFPYFRRGVTRGVVDDLLDPQREKNKHRSIRVEMLSKSANGGWSHHEGAFNPIEERKLKNFGSSPGYIMKWKGDKEPKQIVPATTPVAYERLEASSDADMMKISGVNESSLGQMDSRVQSGRALEARQRQAVIALQTYMSNASRTKRLQGAKHLEIFQDYYVEERMFRILGENGKLVEKIINGRSEATQDIENDITLGKYVATVDDSPMSETFANAQFEEMITILEKMGPAMQQNMPYFADLIVGMSALPRKDEWIERLKQLIPMTTGLPPEMFAGPQAPQPMVAPPQQQLPAPGQEAAPAAAIAPPPVPVVAP